MKNNIIYDYITTSYFNKHNINYKEYKFKFDQSFKFSIGTYKKKIIRHGKIIGYKTIKPNNSSQEDTNITVTSKFELLDLFYIFPEILLILNDLSLLT